MGRKTYPVYDTQGVKLGDVNQQTTSIGVCKRFGAVKATQHADGSWTVWR